MVQRDTRYTGQSDLRSWKGEAAKTRAIMS